MAPFMQWFDSFQRNKMRQRDVEEKRRSVKAGRRAKNKVARVSRRINRRK